MAVAPLRIGNAGFMLQQLADAAPAGQFIRELTQNGIDALQGKSGDVSWVCDEWYLAKHGVRKLAVVDNGSGMSAAELVDYINSFARSGRTQSASGNFGVGAKISAALFSPYGLLYRSWVDGVGHQVLFLLGDEPGLHIWENNTPVCLAPAESKPAGIRDHGTIVTLLGESPEQDTVALRPDSQLTGGANWVGKALCSRYFRTPATVQLSTLEAGGSQRAVAGAETYLDRRAQHRGVVSVTGAAVRWWLLQPMAGTKGGAAEEIYPSRAQLSTLYQGEFYELATGASAAHRMREFGITFGSGLVAIHVEPDVSYYTPDLARTRLTGPNAEPLPWDLWASEFYAKMPKPLREYQDSEIRKRSRSSAQDQAKKLNELFTHLGVGRYRRREDGATSVDSDDTTGGGSRHEEGSKKEASSKAGTAGAKAGSGDASTPSDSGDAAVKLPGGVSLPQVIWKSTEQRDEGDPEDRAAYYTYGTNTLVIFEDFRGYTLLRELLGKEFAGPAAEELIRDCVDDCYSLALCEAVIAARATAKGSAWSPEERANALSAEALTAVALNRGWLLDVARKRLNTKLRRTTVEQ